MLRCLIEKFDARLQQPLCSTTASIQPTRSVITVSQTHIFTCETVADKLSQRYGQVMATILERKTGEIGMFCS